MATAFFDNSWYQLHLPFVSTGKVLIGMVPVETDMGAVYLSKVNIAATNQRWQVFKTGNDTYILRTESSSPDAYLALKDDVNGDTAVMRRVQGATNEVFWKITPFQNGGHRLVNVALGPDWQLQNGNEGRIHMTKNIAGELGNQQFNFTIGDAINDPAFSTIVLPSGATATASGYTPGASSNNSGSGSTDNKGLSVGIKAAIGVSVGVALIALIAGIFMLRRRRKTKSPVEDPPQIYKAELDAGQSSYNAEPTPVKYGYQELSTGHQMQELDAAEQTQTNKDPVELPVTQPAIQR